MEDIPEWFRGARLNFAENLLHFDDDEVALYTAGEGQEVQAITFHQLRNKVTVLASALKNHGVKKGDRIVGVLEVTITLVSFINALSKESNADCSAIVITLQNFYSKKIPRRRLILLILWPFFTLKLVDNIVW